MKSARSLGWTILGIGVALVGAAIVAPALNLLVDRWLFADRTFEIYDFHTFMRLPFYLVLSVATVAGAALLRGRRALDAAGIFFLGALLAVGILVWMEWSGYKGAPGGQLDWGWVGRNLVFDGNLILAWSAVLVALSVGALVRRPRLEPSIPPANAP